jgi:hypothetical protein
MISPQNIFFLCSISYIIVQSQRNEIFGFNSAVLCVNEVFVRCDQKVGSKGF